METITSFSNQTIKVIRGLLNNKKDRIDTGSFYVEGVNFIHQALENGYEIEKLLVVNSLIDSDFKHQVIGRVKQEKIFSVFKEVFLKISNKEATQGMGAILRTKSFDLKNGPTLVLDRIANPGNLGSIMRAASALGIVNVITISPCVDFYNPDAVRASMGGIFWLNLINEKDSKEVFNKLKERGYHQIATIVHEDATEIKELKMHFRPTDLLALWFGSEAQGLDRELASMFTNKLTIKMTGKTDSLNIAESVAVIVHELINL